MARAIEIDPASALPIWRQIEEQVRRLVAAGVLAPATAVPSVRDLSRALRINPATVAKGYQRLADAGVLEVRRGEGTFVAARPPAPSAAARRRALADGAGAFAATALSLGADIGEANAALADAWNDMQQDDGAEP
jgi:GntR family transcriptional regulator